MDGLHLLLVFIQVGSRVRKVSGFTPAAEDCLGYVHLGPSAVSNRADETGGIIKTSHRLIMFCAKTPEISSSSNIVWAGGVEFLAHRVGFLTQQPEGVWRWEAVNIGWSAGVPFRRRGHEFGGAWPLPMLPSTRSRIDYWMCECYMAIGGGLDHYCTFPAEVDIGDFHRISIRI